MLWKVANNQTPPGESADITKFGWEIQDSIPVPVIAKGEPAPPELIHVNRVSVGCRVRSVSLRRVVATKYIFHARHAVIAMVKMVVVIHTQTDEMIKLYMRRMLT